MPSEVVKNDRDRGERSKEITSLTEQLLHTFEELDLLHSVCEILSSSSEPDETNKHILREAMATLAADIGWVVYGDGDGAGDGDGDDNAHQSGRQVLRQNVDARTVALLNETIVDQAIKTGHHVWTDNLMHDISVPGLNGPRAFLCVPLKARVEILGAICLGKYAPDAVFTAGDLKLVQILCAPAANAILLKRIERMGELKRYVSPQLAETILSGSDILLTNKRADLTMFLAELKGFSEAAEEMEPEELVEILNEYLSAMTEVVFAHEGTLDKFVVGSIFGFFGDPVAQDDHAIRAVRMAEEMQHKFADLQTKWRAEGYKPFGLGIGINTGYVTVGNIGSSNRTDYTAIGKNVTVAAKLASMADHAQILIGQRTFGKVKETVPTQFVGTREIGKQPISVYEVEYERRQASDQPGADTHAVPRVDGDRHLLITDRKISHYRVVGKLGEGGMGEVYKAEDLRLDRTVALKILSQSRPDDAVKRRFLREAKVLSALNHPNIATIYEIDEFDGVSFIAMEYVGGRTLKEIIGSQKLTLGKALDIAIPVAEALFNAHGKNIIHRDVKPTNIIVSDEGYVKVLDFGLAKLNVDMPIAEAESHATGILTQAGTIWGTVSYMSPEQAMGVQLDQRSDIFSFGIVLYELITGRRPFTGNNPMAILHAVIFDHPLPISRFHPDAAGELERVVNKALEKRANERYQSMGDTLQDLKRLRKDLSA